MGPGHVVACHHAGCNVPDVAGFAGALSSHARARVVMELTDRHPRAGVNHLWRHFWDLDRPSGPTSDDAVAVLEEVGIRPAVEQAPRMVRTASREARVASVRRYLCLPVEREAEVEALLGDDFGAPGQVVTLWWDGRA